MTSRLCVGKRKCSKTQQHISSVTFGKPQQRQVGSSPARNSNSHDSFNKPTSALNKRDERSNEVQAKKVPHHHTTTPPHFI